MLMQPIHGEQSCTVTTNYNVSYDDVINYNRSLSSVPDERTKPDVRHQMSMKGKKFDKLFTTTDSY